MGCKTSKIKEKTFNQVKVLVETKTIKMDNNGVVRFNFKDSKKYNERSITHIANDIIKRVHEGRGDIKGVDEIFKNKSLVSNIITRGQDADGIFLQYRFPAKLDVAYKIKNKEFTEREVEEAYKQRADEQESLYDEYNKQHLEDENIRYMLEVDKEGFNGFKYSVYLNNKKKFLGLLHEKLGILENTFDRRKPNRKQILQIEELKNTIRKVKTDIKNLSSEKSQLKNYFTYFYRDLKLIKKLLSKGDYANDKLIIENQTIDNLSVIESYLKTLSLITSTGADGFLTLELNKVKDKKGGLEIVQAFESMQKEISLMEIKLNKQKEKLIMSLIDEYLEFEKKDWSKEKREAEVKNLYNSKIKGVTDELSSAEFFVHTIDSSDKSLANQIMATIFNNAHARKEHVDLQRSMQTLKPKLVKRLRDMGHTNKSGFLGKLFNPVTYKEVFFRKTKEGYNRLAQKFKMGWFNIKRDYENRVNDIKYKSYKKGKTEIEKTDIKTAENDLFEDISNTCHILNVNKLPEIREDRDLNAFVDRSVTDEEAEKYKQKIIDDIGEVEYEKLINEQKVKLYDQTISATQYKKRLQEEYPEGIPDWKYNYYLQYLYKTSPFVFGKVNENGQTNKIHFKQKDKDRTYFSKDKTINASMEFLTYYPKRESDLYDKKFEKEIEADKDVLYKAWKLFDKSLAYINQNGHKSFNKNNVFNNSLNYLRSSYQAHIATGAKTIIPLLKNGTLDFIKDVISTSNYQNKTTMQVKGGVKTIDEVINNRVHIYKAQVAAKYSNMSKKKSMYEELPKELQKYLDKLAIKNSTKEYMRGSTSFESRLRLVVSEKIMAEQELDLVDTIVHQLDVVSKFKAKREIETKLTFLHSQVNNIKRNRHKTKLGKLGFSTPKQFNSQALGTFFLEKNLYGINNTANIPTKEEEKKDSKIWSVKVYNSHEKEMNEVINETLDILYNEKRTPEIQAEITALERYKESRGKVITPLSLLEAFVLKLSRFRAFALNVKTQIPNYLMGDFNAREVDGMLWGAGNYDRAVTFLRGKYVPNFKKSDKNNHEIAEMLLSRLNLFQNSANEIYKVKASIFHKNTVRKIFQDPIHTLNPTQFVGYVEKHIQTPQILAMIADIKIENKDGKLIPAFDVKDLKNPLKAFKIDKDGNLALEDDFNTLKNRQTWINNDSLDYARYFGESGTIPKGIAYINGDYRDSSTYALEKWTLGKIFFMFKRWMPATILKRLNIYRDLGKMGEATKANMITGMRSGIRAAEAGSYFGTFGLALGIGISTIKMGKEISRRANERNQKVLAEYARLLTFESLKSGFFDFGKMLSGSMAKTVQMLVNTVAGYRITNEQVERMAGLSKLEGKNAKEIKERLHFLWTGFARSLLFASLRLAAHSLLFPDDDDSENYDTDKGFYSRLRHDPSTTMYYIIENTLTNILDDTNLFISQDGLRRSFLDTRAIDQLLAFSFAADKDIRSGDITAGPNIGRKRFFVNLERVFMPAMFDDMSFGFNVYSKKDFNPKDPLDMFFQSDFKKYQQARKQLWTKEKLRLRKTPEYEGLPKKERDKEITKALSKKFPSIKKYFNEKGELVEESPELDKYKVR